MQTNRAFLHDDAAATKIRVRPCSLADVNPLFTELKLPIAQYRSYLEAIRDDDAADVEVSLEVAQEGERLAMLQGRFEFFDVHSVKNLHPHLCSFSHPFVLAAVYGSTRVVEVLLRHGTSALAVEPTGRQNALHCLVVAAFYEPQRVDELIQSYHELCDILPVETLRRLLLMENEEGFRPMEFAVVQGTLSLMEAFLNTRDVYLMREEHFDLMTYLWYDVTEYEAARAPRKPVSPVALLIGLDKAHERKALEMFREGFLHDWIEGTIAVQTISRACGIFMNLLHVIVLFVYEMDVTWVENVGGRLGSELAPSQNSASSFENANFTFVYCDDFSNIRMSTTLRYAMLTYLVFYGLLGVLGPIYTFFLRCTRIRINISMRKDLEGKLKESIVARGAILDRFCEFLCSALIIVEVLMLPFIHSRGELLVVVDVVRTLLTLLVVWCGLLYIQNAPGMGKAVIFIRELMGDLIVFVLIFTFYISLYARQFMLFFNVNSNQGCIDDFSSFHKAMYNLYLAMLNMLDFTQYDVENRPVLYLNHFVYATLVGILLLNVLIAVFSNTMRRVSEHSEVIVRLSRLVRSNNIHLLLAYLPVVSRMYHYANSLMLKNLKYFVCEEGRVYLVSRKVQQAKVPKEGGNGGDLFTGEGKFAGKDKFIGEDEEEGRVKSNIVEL